MVICPNRFPSPRCRLSISLLNLERSFGDSETITELSNPAMLNVLLGAMAVIVFCPISLDTEAITTCWFPLRARSAWISSEKMRTLFLRQISPIISSSFLLHSFPRGLWELHRMNIFTPDAILCSNSCQFTLYSPSCNKSLEVTTSLSFPFITEKKGG
ncbi:hypothetical protein SDC9_100516 [bioreactor metagenome]|uniref:Uncharacterized protein n=1 Tax=bioreactor metagenome TaxID=1076179 RepID=A0A645AL42_9ZZZZ